MGLELEHGIPSETTFARVWGQIAPDAFRGCFTQWTKRVHEKLTGEVISIDGKSVRGSKSKKRRPIHMISAWVTERELVLGQMCVEEKTNEIPTAPLLLELLDISGCIVTADAMSCQREIAKKIIAGKATMCSASRRISRRSMNTRKPVSRMRWRIRSGIRR